MSPESYIWTPQDMGRLAELNLPKSGYRAYSVSLKHADKRSGVFTITKAAAAADMRCKSRRTADAGFALLFEHGVLARDENIRSGRQRANTYRLRPSRVWKQCAIFARAAYEAIVAKMRERQAAKALRLEALRRKEAAEICGGVPQANLNEEEIRQQVSREWARRGGRMDWFAMEEEIQCRMKEVYDG